MEDRGSDKIIDGLLAQARTFNNDDLKGLLRSIRIDGSALVDWHLKGQPHPDVLHGRLHVQPNAVGKVVEALLLHPKLKIRLDGFPFGQPPAELAVQINFAVDAMKG